MGVKADFAADTYGESPPRNGADFGHIQAVMPSGFGSPYWYCTEIKLGEADAVAGGEGDRSGERLDIWNGEPLVVIPGAVCAAKIDERERITGPVQLSVETEILPGEARL